MVRVHPAGLLRAGSPAVHSSLTIHVVTDLDNSGKATFRAHTRYFLAGQPVGPGDPLTLCRGPQAAGRAGQAGPSPSQGVSLSYAPR